MLSALELARQVTSCTCNGDTSLLCEQESVRTPENQALDVADHLPLMPSKASSHQFTT